MRLDEVAEVRVVLEPLVVLLRGESFVPETNNNNGTMNLIEKKKGKEEDYKLPVFGIQVGESSRWPNAISLGSGRVLLCTHFTVSGFTSPPTQTLAG